MCGIVGMVGFLEHKHKAVMKDLLFLDSLRGKDSTGLTVVQRDRTVLTRKMTVPGYEFIEYPVVEKAFTHGDQLWLGHNRYKTTGAISKANAHPFEVCDEDDGVLLVGAHNGTLTNKWELERKLKGERYDTDSEALFNLLVELPNFKDAVKELRGAWSLAWWDATTNKFHLLRNNERPMSFAWSKDRKQFLFGSEAWMIINAARRNGLELEKNDRGMSCYSTLEDHLYSLEIPQERDKVLPDLQREGGYTGAPVTGFHGMGRFKHWWDESYPVTERKAAAAKTEKKAETDREENKKPKLFERAEKKVITIGSPPVQVGELRGYNKQPLSLAEFKVIKDKGCVWCKDKIGNDTPFAFISEDSLVCTACISDTHVRDCVRPVPDSDDLLDDDLPFDLTDKGRDVLDQENSEEYKSLIAAAAVGEAKKAVG